MKIGYARVSTFEQSFDLQMDALKKAECEKTFQDVGTGAHIERVGLKEALEYVRPGDTLVVWRLDRLGRSLGRLIELINALKSRDIGFKSLVENIDTQTSAGQFFFHITGAFAELERNLIRERTMAGLESARRRGRNGGRPKAIDKSTFEMALSLYKGRGHTVEEICENFSISKRTFYRHLANNKLISELTVMTR
jgi:DNA invertase Pin-like site-specific DNA recombinase